MPYLLPTRCADPMCGEMATRRGRCETHQRPAWQNPSANSRALTGADRARWHKLIIKTDTTCETCGAPATEADHRIPISAGGARFDPANGSALCSACHQAKSDRERDEANRRRRHG